MVYNDLKFKAFVDEEGNKFPLLIPSSKLRQDWSVIFLKIMPCIVLFIIRLIDNSFIFSCEKPFLTLF